MLQVHAIHLRNSPPELHPHHRPWHPRAPAAYAHVSWQVTGIRHDAYAEEHRIRVEEEKPPVAERGLVAQR